MRRKRKGPTPEAPLAPVPSEILDQFVGQGHCRTTSSTPRSVASRKPSSSAPRRRAHPSPRLPGRRDQTRGHDQSPQWHRRQDRAHRRRPAGIDVPRDREGTFEPR